MTYFILFLWFFPPIMFFILEIFIRYSECKYDKKQNNEPIRIKDLVSSTNKIVDNDAFISFFLLSLIPIINLFILAFQMSVMYECYDSYKIVSYPYKFLSKTIHIVWKICKTIFNILIFIPTTIIKGIKGVFQFIGNIKIG